MNSIILHYITHEHSLGIKLVLFYTCSTLVLFTQEHVQIGNN
jgi:hypothetical protein